MSEYPTTERTAPEASSFLRATLVIIAAAILCGVGITGMVYWLITFQWVYFAFVIFLAAGALLFFTQATGPDHA